MTASAPDPPERPKEPQALILFGVTGDLARRKVVPALLELERAHALPEKFFIVGISRSAGDDAELRAKLEAGVREHLADLEPEVWERFAARLYAVSGSATADETYAQLAKRLARLEALHETAGNRLVYLATPASAFTPILQRMSRAGIVRRGDDGTRGGSFARVIIEKPYGHDLASAKALDDEVHSILAESQVFRIDHFLGKETVQNILVFRFGNAIFEPLWNRHHVDHIQITVAESIGVEGRGDFYEETGVVRDMVQNHLLQILALCAMEAPVDFSPDEVRGMKAQLFRSLRPLAGADVETCVVPGQYEGYRSEPGVAADSTTPTYTAIKAHIDNWRWQGVPFYLRTGKGLAKRAAEIQVHFRAIPFCMYGEERVCQLIEPNVLRMRIQPDEGISMRVASKVPGDSNRVGSVDLSFNYKDAFQTEAADAYERLLLDAMRGQATLFARSDEVLLCWEYVQPILDRYRDLKPDEISRYDFGGAGPDAARDMLKKDGRHWLALVQ